MTKYIRIIFAACIVLAAAMAGCNKDKDPEISVSPDELDFTAAGGNKSLTVAANAEWTLTGHTGAAWLTVSSASGSGNAGVDITAAANTATSGRSAELTFTVKGAAPKTVTVTQAGAEPQLSVSETSLSFTAAGGEETFEITANVAWTITGHTGVSWLTLTEASGSGNAAITVTADANATLTLRNATLTVTAQGLTKTVTVTQEGDGEAKIGTTYYATFVEAWKTALAENGNTVTLLKNVSCNNNIDVYNKTVTLNLNGFTLDLVNTERGNTGITVWTNSSLTLIETGGEFNATGSGTGAFVQKSSATVTNATGSAYGAAVEDGSLTVTGNLTTNGTGAYAYNGSEITINGEITGTFTRAYITVGTTDKTAAQYEATTTKAGYRTYTDGTNTVWVKIP